jgi:hypothetical protein
VFARTSRWVAYPLCWLLLMIVPLVVDAFRASAGPVSRTNQFTITSFDATYGARRSNSGLALDVTERITANFPSRYTNHGIERRLDSRYGNTDIGLSNYRVTDAAGKPMSFTWRTEDDGDVTLRIGSASTYVYGRVDYVITYTIARAMVQAPDRQEIYLDVNGTGWQQRFDRVRATVNVPGDLAGNLLDQQACYRGAAGSTATCAISRTGNTITTESVALAPRESMTIAVGFAPGTVEQTVPAPATGLGWWGLVAMPAMAALLLGLALLVRARRLANLLLRDDAPIQYRAPDVQPILAADFLGLPERGAAAQLTQLVLDGHATITGDDAPIGTAPQPRSGLSRADLADVHDLRVQLTDPDAIDRSVRTICSTLFGGGRSIDLDSVRDRDVAGASRERWQLLRDSGLRHTTWLGTTLFWVGYLGLIGFGWWQLALGLSGLVWPFLGLGILAVLLLVAEAHYYPTLGRLTADGRTLRDQLAGLHRFVTMAEADRIAWMQNAVDAPRVSGPDDTSLVDLYEPLLPYAIIFGVENTWRQALGTLYDLAPAKAERPARLPALGLATGWAAGSGYRDYYRRRTSTESFWDARPAWGDGWVAHTGSALARGLDSWASSRDDDSGGSWGSGGGSSRSWSSSSHSSGSSGGGHSGGGMGGGGGGGW